MPRPSELLQQMVRELAAGGRQDALRELGRWLDQLNAQADPTTLRIGGGGGVGTVDAPANAPYLTVGAASGLSAYRQIAHDATLSHSDSGALGSYTLGVVANGHRHLEENIDETNYLVVDAGGRGDFLTLEAACAYLNANGGGLEWVVVIRGGTYTDQDLTLVQGAVRRVHWHGLGGVVLGGLTVLDQYSNATFYRVTFQRTSGALIYGVNTSGHIFHDCVFLSSSYNYPILGSGFVATFYDCAFSVAPAAGGSAFEGGQSFYRCTFDNNGGGWTFDADVPGAPISYLYNCVLRDLGGGGTIRAAALANRMNVCRCQYNTANTTGTITILDGDVPAAALAGYVPTSRTIGTTAPLSGGGDLSANRTLAIADAAADGATKGAAAFASNDFEAAAGVISIDYTNGQAADATHKGFLTAADWNTFNGKQAAGEYVRWRGSSGTTPSSPSEGDVWNDTTSGNVIKIYANGDWRTLN